MSEAIPRSPGGNFEQLSDWRERKERAPEEVAQMIADIDGYDSLSTQEKITTLLQLIEALGDPEDPAANREGLYKEKELGRQIEILREEERHRQAMERLVG